MDKSRFDQMIKTLITKNRSGGSSGNAVTEASKLLEITNTTSDIERELDQCKSVIMKNLQRYESLIATLGSLRTGYAACKLAVFDDELKDFEENARLQINEIEETRNIFLQGLRNEDENRQKFHEIIREITQFRDHLLEEINTADQNIPILTAKLKDTDERLKRVKMENNTFFAQMQSKETDLDRRRREKMAKLNLLMASKN